VLGGMVDTEPQIDGRSVRLPVEDRGGALMEAVRRLDEAKLSVDDVAVRRPTLDDVFLTLTGHEAKAEAEREEVAA
jgi:ABC-2 type transport system ATP-binding protein